MRRTVAAIVVVLSLGLAAPHAGAVTREDPDDVVIRLDLARVSLECVFEDDDRFCAIGVGFYERVRLTPRRLPVTRFWLDAFGSSAPDFVLRFRYAALGRDSYSLGCRLLRLSDHEVLEISDVEVSRRHDSYYTQIPSPALLTADANWRVTAVLRGEVQDAAPDTGWYQHL